MALYQDKSALVYDFTNGVVVFCENESSFEAAQWAGTLYGAVRHFRQIGERAACDYRPQFKRDTDFETVYSMAFPVGG